MEYNLDNIIDSAIYSTFNNGNDLLKCFRPLEEINISSTKAIQRLKLYVLNNNQYQFEYDGLKRLIRNNITNYVMNRRAYQEAVNNNEIQLATMEALKKLIKIQKNAIEQKDYGSGGELGEILLYIFCEAFLQAKKILSKVEIKTNNKDYVKGFDGIHFLVKEYPNYKAYQIVYGEAKIKNELDKAIDAAFTSLNNCFLHRETDLKLLDGKFFEEIASNDELTLEILKSIIIPGYRNTNSSIETENAFGIFIGYTFTPPQNTTLTPKEEIAKKVQQDITSVKQNIINHIKKFETNSDFYMFFLPFNNAAEDKSNIMLEILGGEK